jgi:hypothetical protein
MVALERDFEYTYSAGRPMAGSFFAATAIQPGPLMWKQDRHSSMET